MIRSPLLLLLSLLLLSETSSADPSPKPADDPWPSFRGANGTGQLVTELGEGPFTLETRWVRPLGSGYSGIAVGGGLLVTAARGGDSDVVQAFDPEDGKEVWRYALEPAYLGHDGSHDGPVATPAIADGRVFMVGAGGRVAALDASDGRELWTRHLVDDFDCEEPRYGFAGSPAVAGDVVVLSIGGDEGSLAGFDVADGALLWRSLPDSIYSGSPIVAQLGGRTQVLMLSVSHVAGLDPATGEILWQQEHAGHTGAMGSLSQSVLPLGEDRLFVKHSEDGTQVLGVHREPNGSFALSQRAESRGLKGSYSPPSKVGDVIYGYTGRLLSAIDSDTGELLWRSRPPGDGFLVAVNDQLAVLTKKGTLHLATADRQGWTENDRLELFDELAWTPPSAAGTSIYARSLGAIARVDLVRGGEGRSAEPVQLPAILGDLAAEIRGGADATEAVDLFLDGRELPLVEGEGEGENGGEGVLFLWRGEAEDVAVAGDMLGIRREEPMHRLEGSDLWWWQTRLDRRTRVNYLYLIDNEPRVDPSHGRRSRSSILGPNLDFQRDIPLEMSWFAMPEWPGWRAPGRGYLDSIEIRLPAEDEAAGKKARFPVWLPPGYEDGDARYPVIYVHHPAARDAGNFVETLDRVVGRSVAPLIAVFLETSPGDALAEVLVPAVDARFRTLADADSRANIGSGFYALTALDATFRHPGTFGRSGIRSYVGIEQEIEELKATVGDLSSSDFPLRVYLEWGEWDIHSALEAADIRISGRWLDSFLRQRGWQVIGGEMPDSADFSSWNNRTDLMLRTLFPLDGEIPHSALRHWLGTDPPPPNTP